MVAAGRPLGLLVIGKHPTSHDTDARFELETAAAFAGHAALVLELSRVQRDRERMAVFSDRDRIARDLHDVVVQRLFATGLQLRGLSRLVDGPPGERVAAAAGELDQTVNDIRQTIFSLASPTGEGTELRAKIREIVQQAEHHLGLQPSLRVDGPVDRGVPEPIHPHLLAVLREALSNIARHARATRIQVLVRITSEDVLVEVCDDGCGPAGASQRSGLANLRKRALDLGGHMEFGPGTDGTGTTVTWKVPLSPPIASSDVVGKVRRGTE
jgi:signal transduction histidine kinase